MTNFYSRCQNLIFFFQKIALWSLSLSKSYIIFSIIWSASLVVLAVFQCIFYCVLLFTVGILFIRRVLMMFKLESPGTRDRIFILLMSDGLGVSVLFMCGTFLGAFLWIDDNNTTTMYTNFSMLSWTKPRYFKTKRMEKKSTVIFPIIWVILIFNFLLGAIVDLYSQTVIILFFSLIVQNS